MGAQLLVAPCQVHLGITIKVAESRRQAVAAMLLRHAPQRPQRVLQTFGQRHEALAAEHHMGVLEARERQPAAAVYVGVEITGPGHVRHHGRGELVIGRSKASNDVARTLIAAGVPTDISDSVRGALWAKLITNCAYNALSAITQLPYGRLVKGEGVTTVLRDIVDECVAVAKADGVTLPGDVDAAVRKIAETAAGQYASTAQDLARGKRSEIDHLNGFIVRRGEALGVATPAHRLLHAIVKLIEASEFHRSRSQPPPKLELAHE
jgi:2-dehydropantoate 2-reductase